MELKVNSAACHFYRKIMEKTLVQGLWNRRYNALLYADFMIGTICCFAINLKNFYFIFSNLHKNKGCCTVIQQPQISHSRVKQGKDGKEPFSDGFAHTVSLG